MESVSGPACEPWNSIKSNCKAFAQRRTTVDSVDVLTISVGKFSPKTIDDAVLWYEQRAWASIRETPASIGHHLTLFGQNTFQFYLPRVCECDCVINSIQIIEASDKRSNRPNRWVFVFVIIRIDALLDDPHIIRLGEAKAKKHTHTAAWTWIYGVRPKKHL